MVRNYGPFALAAGTDVRRAAMHLCLLILGLLLASHARAETPPPSDGVQAAKGHFRKGTQLFDIGKYLEAAVEYEEAFKLSDRPGFLFNMAQAYRLGGKPRDALAAYRGFLRRVSESPQRAEAEQHIAALETVVAEESARERAEKEARITAREAEEARDRDAATRKKQESATEPAVSAAPPEKPRRKKWVWAVVAGTVVLAGVGVGVGLGLGLQPKNPTPQARSTFVEDVQ